MLRVRGQEKEGRPGEVGWRREAISLPNNEPFSLLLYPADSVHRGKARLRHQQAGPYPHPCLLDLSPVGPITGMEQPMTRMSVVQDFPGDSSGPGPSVMGGILVGGCDTIG